MTYQMQCKPDVLTLTTSMTWPAADDFMHGFSTSSSAALPSRNGAIYHHNISEQGTRCQERIGLPDAELCIGNLSTLHAASLVSFTADMTSFTANSMPRHPPAA